MDRVFQALRVHWKTLFMILYPFVLIPLFEMVDEEKHIYLVQVKCLYVVLLMAGYWVFEILPLAITSMFPLVLFPVLDILEAKKVTLAYFKEANMMFVGGLIIALAVEFCNLHIRISLFCIKMIGCSYRRLNFGLITLTMLISMWISNTAATAMMIPIIQAVLQELEEQGIGNRWEPLPPETDEATVDPASRRPTRVAMCFYISTAYAATIGGVGCVVGTGTNLAYKGIFEGLFPQTSVSFVNWLGCNIPLMLAIMYPSWVWMQVWYMGLFRPNSTDAQAIAIGAEGEAVTRKVLSDKLEDLGPVSFHEIMVAIMFILAVLLWFFRSPNFIPGWSDLLLEKPGKIGDSTAAMIVVMLLFMLPAQYGWIYMFSKNEEKRQTKRAPPLVTWRYINQKMHWSLIFLMGGGFALAEGINATKMGDIVADAFEPLVNELSRFELLVTILSLTMIITQLTSSVSVANILLPIIGEICKSARINPLYLMMPVTLCCSFSFCLPVSTPPNAIAAAPCNMNSWDMIKVAWVIQLISFAMLLIIFPPLGQAIYNLDEFPDWAAAQINTTTNATK